jgi:hypothetical protein
MLDLTGHTHPDRSIIGHDADTAITPCPHMRLKFVAVLGILPLVVACAAPMASSVSYDCEKIFEQSPTKIVNGQIDVGASIAANHAQMREYQACENRQIAADDAALRQAKSMDAFAAGLGDLGSSLSAAGQQMMPDPTLYTLQSQPPSPLSLPAPDYSWYSQHVSEQNAPPPPPSVIPYDAVGSFMPGINPDGTAR